MIIPDDRLGAPLTQAVIALIMSNKDSIPSFTRFCAKLNYPMIAQVICR